MKLACVAILCAACNLANADLADLEDLEVRVSGGRSLVTGAESMSITLEYGAVAGSVPHDCAVLGYVDVAINGHQFDDKSYGEWRDTSLAGSAPYCNVPEFRIERAGLSDGEAATVEIDDGSRRIVVAMPRLRAPRSIDRVDATPLEPGGRVDLVVGVAPGDQLASGRATAELAGDGSCTKYPLIDVGLDPAAGGYSFEVPDWIDLQDNQFRAFSCGAPLVAGQPREADLVLTVGVEPAATCEGADRCAITWSTGVATTATAIP